MFISLSHAKLDVYKVAGEMLLECYKLVLLLPEQERFNLSSQLRRAALSVKLNIAEGSSRKSFLERKRFYEIARGSIVELDTGFETAIQLDYFTLKNTENIGELLNRCYRMLSKMIIKKETE